MTYLSLLSGEGSIAISGPCGWIYRAQGSFYILRDKTGRGGERSILRFFSEDKKERRGGGGEGAVQCDTIEINA